MLRILVEIDEANEYAADETMAFAKSLSAFIKKKFNRKLNDIDSDTDWFVGFVALPASRKEDIKHAFLEWADIQGVGTSYRIEDMEASGEGSMCRDNECVCDGCVFAFNKKEPCRIGCTEA